MLNFATQPWTPPQASTSISHGSSACISKIVPILISTTSLSTPSVIHAPKNPVHPFIAASNNHKLAACTNSLLTTSFCPRTTNSSASAPNVKRWWRRPAEGSVADWAAAVLKKWMNSVVKKNSYSEYILNIKYYIKNLYFR